MQTMVITRYLFVLKGYPEGFGAASDTRLTPAVYNTIPTRVWSLSGAKVIQEKAG